MKNDDKKTKKYGIILFVLSLLVLAIIVVGYLIRNIANCEGDMFSYSGAVIGGGLTLVGVIITIMYQEKKSDEDKIDQEKQRNEDLAIQYKPYLSLLKPVNFGKEDIEIKFDEFSIINDEEFEHGKDYKEYRYIEMPLSIKNCGRGEAKIGKISINHEWFVEDGEIKLSFYEPVLDIINPQESLYLTLRLWVYNYEKVVELEKSYSYEIIIEYTDFLNSFTYSKELNLCLCYREDESDEVLISESSGDPLKKMVITVQ